MRVRPAMLFLMLLAVAVMAYGYFRSVQQERLDSCAREHRLVTAAWTAYVEDLTGRLVQAEERVRVERARAVEYFAAQARLRAAVTAARDAVERTGIQNELRLAIEAHATSTRNADDASATLEPLRRRRNEIAAMAASATSSRRAAVELRHAAPFEAGRAVAQAIETETDRLVQTCGRSL